MLALPFEASLLKGEPGRNVLRHYKVSLLPTVL
jgi:hypothetical protein